MQIENIAGKYLAPESGGINSTEERELARKALIAQQRNRAGLRLRFHHQHSRQGGTAGKVARPEHFVAG